MGATSAHFGGSELACHHCGRNECTQALVDALESFRSAAVWWWSGQPLQAPFPGVIVDDAYRCPVHNAAVGGAAHSQHVEGAAADVRIYGLSPANLEEIARMVPAIKGIGRSTPPMKYLHLDVRADPAEWCYNAEGSEVPYYPPTVAA